ncbi:Protein-L-isoaspartate O-methyltransferase domain-containing protein 1 [Papilio machaon]|uniref:Protein-L-isoaspartate O-methyltransferase domain-containing protein 1 n=1 Tax=Papilio machaon TaxID=76193 RepID=A0A0N0PAM4_PAPMA|nr:Protein-L-isoaspartate O-methyltransferase domain-containing protein 1 [Papilio machaon]
MGGAVSSGRDNNELVDNLKEGSYIRTPEVERVFRALDRGDYMLPGDRERAYKDIAWRSGLLHLSSPCIYSEVMEGLELNPGLSFLNIGSGTGYLSTMVGLVLGSGGISHGVELHAKVVEYAIMMQRKFIERSYAIDDFDFCEPKFFLGNGLCLSPLTAAYDRVYCGAACPEKYANYFKQLIRIGGILVMPLNDTLVQVRRVGAREWVTRSLLNVSFAPLQLPNEDDGTEAASNTGTDARQTLTLDEQTPPALQVLSRGAIRRALLRGLLCRHPELREVPRVPVPRSTRTSRNTRRCPRRICIPINENRARNFNMFHDLEREDGANEMNALLSLVLSMGENRVAGALRFDASSDTSNSADDSSEPECDLAPEPDPEDSDAPRIRLVNQTTGELGRYLQPMNLQPRYPRPLTVEFHDVDETAPPPQPQSQPQPQPPLTADRDLPADVDVYLDNTEEPRGLSASDMEWEESRTAAGRRQPSSDDDTESASKGIEGKRQKLDSGIGEANSPSSSSQEKTERSTTSDTGDATDDTEPPLADGKYLLEEWSECGGEPRRRAARRAAGGGGGGDGGGAASEATRRRRARLVRRALSDLPLPQMLKVYVNWGRSLPQ